MGYSIAPHRFLATAIFLIWAVQAVGATITVDGTTCTPVEAIESANNNDAGGNGCVNGSGADIVFVPSNTTLSVAAQPDADGKNATPSITSIITIRPQASSGAATIQRSTDASTPVFRLFHIAVGGNLSLDRIQLQNGVEDKGGAIFTGGTLSLNNSTLFGNFATGSGSDFGSGSGGGIFTPETLHEGEPIPITTINNSVISGNSASSSGGGMLVYGITTLNNSTVSKNSAVVNGGGINASDTFNINNSTVSGNTSANGGGIFVSNGTATFSNSTVSGNMATTDGGGIFTVVGTTNLNNSTVSDNSAANGGGILNAIFGEFVLSNSLIANSSGEDCLNDDPSATVQFTGKSLIEDGSCGANTDVNSLTGDPKLGALASNGGSTKTHALLIGSPAIDIADDAICAAAPVNGIDQRGILRPQGNQCDIGAYEQGGEDDTTFFVTPLPNGKAVTFGL